MAPPSKPADATAAPADADLEDDVAANAKTAEDRKAAIALASLDSLAAAAAGASASASEKNVDKEAMNKAMKNLKLGASGTAAKKVKVDPADVALVVDQLELSKTKATELLKQHEGNAVKALRAYITVT